MSGLVDMVDASTVQDLEKMGFSADQVKIAMVRCGNDVNAAVDMLTSGGAFEVVGGGDREDEPVITDGLSPRLVELRRVPSSRM